MAYNRTTWTDGASPPISAANLNIIELGIVNSLPMDGISPMTGQLKTIAGTGATAAIAPNGDPNTGICFPAADTIAFSRGGLEAMRIDSSGNVAIGGTVPASTRLYVGGTLNATWFSGPVSGNATSATNLSGGGQGQLPYQSNTATTSFLAAGVSKQVLVSNGTFAPSWVELDMTYVPTSSFKKSVRVATTANLPITSANNTTLNLTSSLTALDGIALATNDRILVKDQAGATQNGIYVYTNSTTLTRPADVDESDEVDGATVNVDSGTVNGGYLFSNNFKSGDVIGTNNMIWYRLISTGDASSTNPLGDGVASAGASTFYSRADHVHPTDTSRAPLNAPSFTGNVTIGSTLIVQGGSSASPSISPTGDSNTGIYFPAADTIGFVEGGSEAMRLTSGGSLGIGTLSPLAKLQVTTTGTETAPGISVRHTTTTGNAASSIWLGDNDSYTLRIGKLGVAGGTYGTYAGFLDNVSGPIAFSFNGTEAMRMTSTAFSVGTSLATGKITVQPSIIVVENASANAPVIAADFGSSVARIRTSSIGTSSAYPLGLFIDTTERMRITTAGNIGIGTTNPTSLLHVNGTPAGGALITLYDVTGITTATTFAGISFISPNNGPDFSIGKITETTTSAFGFRAGNSELVRITSAGNVGIGTVSPSSILHISSATGSFTPMLRIANTGVSSGFQSVMGFYANNSTATPFLIGKNNTNDSNGSVFISNQANTPMFFETNGQLRMTLTAGGSLGIGVTNPTYQLQLSTDAAAKLTSSTWITTSDSRIKTVTGEYQKGLSEICKLRPVTFEYNGKAGVLIDGKEYISILAQEAKEVFPETVGTFLAKLNPEDEDETLLYNFNIHAIHFAMINAIKELNAKVEALEARLNNQ